MRFIIFGVGAIGGSFAAALAEAGQEVIGIARGKMLAAMQQAGGLRFRTPRADRYVPLKAVAAPSDIQFGPDDVIVLAMKSQDTAAALLALREAGVTNQAIVCAQNGVANERLALRLFPNVYGMTVMVPGEYTAPGEAICYGEPRYGLLDLGRYPKGRDAVADQIAAAFEAADFDVQVMDDVMVSKHTKLLGNLGNVQEAALGPTKRDPAIAAAVRAEAEAVYRAAGIRWHEAEDKSREAISHPGPVEGVMRDGGSSTQSLKRGTPSIETDYLNGEIVLLGRLHGVPTPLNAGLVTLGQELIAAGAKPGSITAADLKARLGLPK